jgi:hypothetical protein
LPKQCVNSKPETVPKVLKLDNPAENSVNSEAAFYVTFSLFYFISSGYFVRLFKCMCYVLSNDRVPCKRFGRTSKETVVAHVDLLSQHLPTESKENQGKTEDSYVSSLYVSLALGNCGISITKQA